MVALIVLGPERLPKVARFAGLWVRRARAQWNSVKVELERELAAEEIKRGVQDTREAIQDLGDSLRAEGDQAQREFESMREQTLDAVLPAEQRTPAALTPSDHRDDDTPPPAPAQDDGTDAERR